MAFQDELRETALGIESVMRRQRYRPLFVAIGNSIIECREPPKGVEISWWSGYQATLNMERFGLKEACPALEGSSQPLVSCNKYLKRSLA